ncbi:MAG TPA: NAD-dependent epimerase/dehydratase family protein [Rhodopseudomonas sp.]|uniref:NAD-dependent epimerase/dehydratase family protein n=1 Tax=Rhodopseudomonas sp. TaxID=1078 RepID=UPI002ED922F6
MLGGGGFIGTNLCRRLVREGWRVRAFGRRSAFRAQMEGVEWYEGDLSDATSLINAVQSVDVIFHLANSATPQSANANIAADVQSNLLPSLALLDLASKQSIGRIVFVSSGGTIYGPSAVIPTPESAPTDPMTAYAISKLAFEKYLALYGAIHGLQYRILRVSNPYGPFQKTGKNQGLIAALISRRLADDDIEIWGDGSVVRDFIYVDDVVDAMLAAADHHGNERIFNIGSGEGKSIRDIIGAVEAQLGSLSTVWKPNRPVDLPVSILAIDRAKQALGWSPKISLQEGIARTIAWWRSEHP